MGKGKNIKILIVDDEVKLVSSIRKQLIGHGYNVDVAYDGQVATEMISSGDYSLVILDINLPKKSGFDILNEFKSKNIAFLILSARHKVDDRITSLHMGADDYLVKPFDSSELLARVNAILRRYSSNVPARLGINDLVMDPVTHKVTRSDKEIHLSPTEYCLLEFFLKNQNQLLTRQRIAEQVWGYTFDTGTNIVDVYVSYLRKAIDKNFKKKLIHTIHGEGFILSE
jgi:DNA-binding response OmpR family regulator